MSLSEVQSAFIAPAGAGLTTAPARRPRSRWRTPRRRRNLGPRRADLGHASSTPPPASCLLVLLVLALLAGAGWWVVQGRQQPQAGAPRHLPTARRGSRPSAARPAVRSAAGLGRLVDGAHGDADRSRRSAPARAPHVTLKSDLAFGFNSATLSPEAKAAVAHVARRYARPGSPGRSTSTATPTTRLRGVRAGAVAAPGRRRVRPTSSPSCSACRSRSSRPGTARRTRREQRHGWQAGSRTAGSRSRCPEP